MIAGFCSDLHAIGPMWRTLASDLLVIGRVYLGLVGCTNSEVLGRRRVQIGMLASFISEWRLVACKQQHICGVLLLVKMFGNDLQVPFALPIQPRTH